MSVKTRLQTGAIFVSVDMEGCATIVHWDEVRPSGSAEYERARRLMTAEVNAVTASAFDGGATRVVVNDSHSTMRNLISTELDPRIESVSGRLKPRFMLEGLTPEFDAAIFLGYHGAIGDQHAVLGHTYSPRIIYECRINGEPVGETTINAALAGHFEVPVALVSGDRTTLAEAARNLPWAVGVETKASVSYYAAETRSPAEVLQLLRDGTSRAMRDAASMRPYVATRPITMEIDTLRTSQADVLETIPGMRRLGGRRVAYTAEDFAEIYRALMNVIYAGTAA